MSLKTPALRRWLTGFAILLGCGQASTHAESRTFPYEATVRSGEVEVRSGPGQRYYVTGRVRLDERVTVHRHDPGGWYMIAPPAGSFSYLDAALVRRTGDDAGVVEVPPAETAEAPRAIVRIGSELSDEHTYYGRELAHGDEVRILGEKLLNTDQGAVRMYRIAPPALEYRWVKGDFIVAAGETLPPGSMANVTARPLTITATSPTVPAVVTDPFAAPHRTATLTPAAATPTTSPAVSTAARDALTELDLRYLELIQQSPEHWDLDGLVAQYNALRVHAAPEQQEQIDARLSALESRRVVWEQYQEFLQLTNGTAQRDAELAAMQSGIQLLSSETSDGANHTVIQASGSETEPVLGEPVPAAQMIATLPDAAPLPTTVPPAAATTPQLAGAGVVQRMPTGRRGQFVLVLADPRGRVLATLNAPPNLGLERYVGQSLGVVGQRYFDPRMRSDVINVRQILPVQLAQ